MVLSGYANAGTEQPAHTEEGLPYERAAHRFAPAGDSTGPAAPSGLAQSGVRVSPGHLVQPVGSHTSGRATQRSLALVWGPVATAPLGQPPALSRLSRHPERP